jgi:hypothetical protein
MSKKIKPTKEEIELYEDLCSAAFSRRARASVNVGLNVHPIDTFVTKSYILKADVGSTSEGGSVDVPSTVIIKRYIPGVERVSDSSETAERDFELEKAMMEMGITINGGRNIRIYPELYSRSVPECDEIMTLIREFIAGKTLEELGREKVGWRTTSGSPSLSALLDPLTLQHVESPSIAAKLNALGLLEFGTPEQANELLIAQKQADRFVRRLNEVVLNTGQELEKEDEEKAKESYFELERRVASKREFLGIVDGELDVFPHHGMVDNNSMRGRLIDATLLSNSK